MRKAEWEREQVNEASKWGSLESVDLLKLTVKRKAAQTKTSGIKTKTVSKKGNLSLSCWLARNTQNTHRQDIHTGTHKNTKANRIHVKSWGEIFFLLRTCWTSS